MDGKFRIPDLWKGMLDLYAAPGVAQACIELQDACDADVLLLLTAALLSNAGIPLSPVLADQLVAETRVWRTEVVIPLRTLRRRWRGLSSAASLREQLKALELDAERTQVCKLQALLDAASEPESFAAGTDLLGSNCTQLVPGLAQTPDCADALALFRERIADAFAAESRGS